MRFGFGNVEERDGLPLRNRPKAELQTHQSPRKGELPKSFDEQERGPRLGTDRFSLIVAGRVWIFPHLTISHVEAT
jgi:hypothetical protein